MAKLDNGTWVLVADGEKALLLENVTDAEDPYLQVVEKERQSNPPDRDQGTDRPGRMNDTGVAQRSALSETDFHKLAKERFADELADILLKHAQKGDFQKLVIVAGPQVLGNIRPALHSEVSDKVIAEIPKTLTGQPVDEIEKHLRAEL